MSHKLWDLVVCCFDDDMKGKVGGGAPTVRHAQLELVGCGLHPLVAGLDVVHMAVHNVPVGEGSWQREGAITPLVRGWRRRHGRTLLADANACVALLETGAGKDVLDVAELGRVDQADHQLVQGGVLIGRPQMGRGYGSDAALVDAEDFA